MSYRAFAVVAVLALTVSASAAPFSLVPYNYPGASNTNLYGINNAGQIVGYYDSLVVTPIPAALPLFATGLSVLGLFGSLIRKRKGVAMLSPQAAARSA